MSWWEAVSRRMLLDLGRCELEEVVAGKGMKGFRARQIWHGIYHELASSYSEITTLPVGLRKRLSQELPMELLKSIGDETSSDGMTRKVVFELNDGAKIEAVLMYYNKRRTVCVSTQVGCEIGCKMCATGKIGFRRDLTAGEIVAQVLYFARGQQITDALGITNVVYMGMGEPFLNYDATIKSIRILNDKDGFCLRARAFTVSTVGIVPMIKRFAEEDIQANLAVSLHAPNDDLRDQLVGINRKYPLSELIDACKSYITRTNRRVSFEYVLIESVNDSVGEARRLGQLLSGLLCHVNLIPLNPVSDSGFGPPTAEAIERFSEEIEKAGVTVTVRNSRGVEIHAACGQLQGKI